MGKIKAILFDLDNTLIDFMLMKRLCCEAAIDAMIGTGLRIPRKKALKILFKLYDRYGLEYPKIFQVFLRKVLGKVDYKILASGIISYRRVKEGYLRPYPGVIPTLIKLKEMGYRLGIVTDAPRLKAWLRLVALGIQDFFDFVLAFEDTKQKKPSEMPFRKAIEKLRLKPSQIAMVGDSPSKDIAGAKRLRMVTILAKYGQTEKIKGKSQKPDYEIACIEELTEKFKNSKVSTRKR
jgi:putative hydrolase of the HAD superfamily